MGNQSSSSIHNQSLVQKLQSKHNKHFNNTYFSKFGQSQINQLFKDLQIDDQKHTSSQVNSQSKHFIHCLEFNEDLSFDKVHSRLSSRLELQFKHLFNIKNMKVHQQKSLCSISKKLFISQQKYDFTLKNLINKKLQEKQSFSQEQILTMMSKIVQAVIWMNDNEFKNVILDSEAITFVSEFVIREESLQNYLCKIVDQDITQSSCYRKLLQNLIEKKQIQKSQKFIQKINLDFYLSPQLLQEIQNHNFYPSVSLKSDIFALGMLMMQICCQQEMYFCYNMKTLTLDYESLIHRIAKISYSNQLKLLIAEMLEYDENNRIGFVSLKEKIDKIMVKPFDETRKLKRRSSSTMLKQLLSCSRASYSLQNCSKPTLKNNSSCKISTVSLSVKKEVDPSPKNENNTQQRSNSLTKCNSLTKSNSLVNLKCKTNSFLTSKKSTLSRVNSNKKLETETKDIMQKQIKIETNKVDYSKILKNRMKPEPKNLECPLGDQSIKSPTEENIFKEYVANENMKIENLRNEEVMKNEKIKIEAHKAIKPFDGLMTDRSIHEDELERVSYRTINHSNFEESHLQNQPIKVKTQENTQIQSFNKFNHSFVQKKVINLDNAKISSSQKMLKCKSSLATVNSIQKTDSPLKIEISKKENFEDIKTTKVSKSPSKQISKPKESSISLKKMQDNRSKKLLMQKPEQKVTQQIKNTNKNWIIGKLKAKNFIEIKSKQKNLGLQKNKSTGKKKESSFTKVKSVSFAPQMNTNLQTFQKQKENISAVGNLEQSRTQLIQASDQFKRGDTIIKRLQMTDQKSEIGQQAQIQQDIKENIESNVKEQLKFVEKVLYKCALSKSRWQDQSQQKNMSESSYNHQNLIKYSEYKEKLKVPQKVQSQESKFKKKSKVIDIDLGKINSKSEQCTLKSVEKRQLQKQVLKNEKQTATSKMKKLKQLTIFTEDDIQKEMGQQTRYPENKQTENKQNSMRNSNLQDLVPEIKLSNIEQKMKKSSMCNLTPNVSSSLLGFSQIPYQRIEYVNKMSTIIQPAFNTPSNLNELNKIYRKGMTVQSSIQQTAMHKKNNSTLSKPFQQIELYYQKESEPFVKSPNLNKNHEESPQQNMSKKSITIGSIKRQTDIFSMNNSQELTFRLKTNKVLKQQNQVKLKQTYFQDTFQSHQLLNIQKQSYFERQDGSFVMREQNPHKKIQTSSIIGQKSYKNNQGTNNFEEFFNYQNSKFNNKQFQSQYQGYKQSFLDEQEENKMMRQDDMNSSCKSINLSEIEYNAQRGESLIFHEQQKDQQGKQLNQKQRKFKHISILQPEEDNNNRSHDLSINIKNLKAQKQHNNIIVQSNHESQQNTYRGYLKSDNENSYIIELNEDLVYEGKINKQGLFQGSGMIYRKDKKKGKNILIYSGAFVSGFYQGFGTLYHIENSQNKILRIPSYSNRITFESKRNQSTNSQVPIKYEGQFSQGMQNGFGTYFFANGDKFSGCIKQGTIQGYGTYHIVSTNQILSGMWKNNKFLN